ncbi:unnamed protein product [Prorocentrum cordatum]|uniref:Exostosin GT47 domain-containing protein n=1 Tax=Prorocentrum cordatum TaxID=2364126 RepID=A0ABN9V1X3_9DINO|nr:unnamed protein product [Polarella glacialis]
MRTRHLSTTARSPGSTTSRISPGPRGRAACTASPRATPERCRPSSTSSTGRSSTSGSSTSGPPTPRASGSPRSPVTSSSSSRRGAGVRPLPGRPGAGRRQRGRVALGGPRRRARESGVDDPEGYARQRDLARPMLATVGRLRAFFWRIFFEAKDVEVEGVRTMPIGLTEFFLRGGVAETAAAAIASASVADKPGMVKGAFNFYHDLSHCTRGWGEAQRLRTAARDWSRGAAARAARVDSTLTKRADWWAEVARHRFLMAPNGCGVQTPKQLEALLVLTIPIARRGPYPAFDDLVRYGFPLVVVDEWDDLTPERLSSWWEEMSPRLPSFRDNCLTSDGYWRLFTGEAERCQ